jgi:hypothetical protein
MPAVPALTTLCHPASTLATAPFAAVTTTGLLTLVPGAIIAAGSGAATGMFEGHTLRADGGR